MTGGGIADGNNEEIELGTASNLPGTLLKATEVQEIGGGNPKTVAKHMGVSLGEAGAGLMQMTVVASSTQIAAIKKSADSILASQQLRDHNNRHMVVGSFNSTHSREHPQTDSKPIGGIRNVKHQAAERTQLEHCLTQTTLPCSTPKCSIRKDFETCTSCKAGTALVIRFPKEQAGACHAYEDYTTPHALCRDLQAKPGNDGTGRSDPTKNGKLCTKMLQTVTRLDIPAIRDDRNDKELKTHFKGLEGGWNNQAVAHCTLWKQTICSIENICEVKKEVHCLKVCKMRPEPQYDIRRRKKVWVVTWIALTNGARVNMVIFPVRSLL